jgi:dTDP-4-amino-4,6-dideoxygalactose transaminase
MALSPPGRLQDRAKASPPAQQAAVKAEGMSERWTQNGGPLKNSLQALAIMGGAPAFEQPLHVGRPNLGDRSRFMHRMTDLLDRRWLTNRGPYVEEFEAKIAALTGARNCVVTCNATIALEVATRALGMTGSVIVPSFTFIATAHALQRQGVMPLFCDIDPDTHNIDPARVEALIRPDTTGILGVHLWGRGCDVGALQELADCHGLKLLFDAAHAFGCTHKGRPIGRFGCAEVFSFHATKAINSFEGGAIVTDDDELAARLRLMINFGFSDYDQVVYLGTNGKMSEPCAAMGLTSMESMENIFAHNQTNHDHYRRCLSGIPGLTLAEYDKGEVSNYQYVVLEIDSTLFGLSRDDLQQVLIAENVFARRYFFPGCHRAEPYRSMLTYSDLSLPVTDNLCSRVLCVPTGTNVDRSDIEQVCNIIALAANAPSALIARLRS